MGGTGTKQGRKVGSGVTPREVEKACGGRTDGPGWSVVGRCFLL